MKEVTLKVPEQKLHFFMELIKQLGIEVAEDQDIPEVHKTLVRERIKETKPEDYIPWDEARKQFNLKGR